eukprot:747593-Hanusia_phi.AAC.4
MVLRTKLCKVLVTFAGGEDVEKECPAQPDGWIHSEYVKLMRSLQKARDQQVKSTNTSTKDGVPKVQAQAFNAIAPQSLLESQKHLIWIEGNRISDFPVLQKVRENLGFTVGDSSKQRNEYQDNLTSQNALLHLLLLALGMVLRNDCHAKTIHFVPVELVLPDSNKHDLSSVQDQAVFSISQIICKNQLATEALLKVGGVELILLLLLDETEMFSHKQPLVLLMSNLLLSSPEVIHVFKNQFPNFSQVCFRKFVRKSFVSTFRTETSSPSIYRIYESTSGEEDERYLTQEIIEFSALEFSSSCLAADCFRLIGIISVEDPELAAACIDSEMFPAFFLFLSRVTAKDAQTEFSISLAFLAAFMLLFHTSQVKSLDSHFWDPLLPDLKRLLGIFIDHVWQAIDLKPANFGVDGVSGENIEAPKTSQSQLSRKATAKARRESSKLDLLQKMMDVEAVCLSKRLVHALAIYRIGMMEGVRELFFEVGGFRLLARLLVVEGLPAHLHISRILVEAFVLSSLRVSSSLDDVERSQGRSLVVDSIVNRRLLGLARSDDTFLQNLESISKKVEEDIPTLPPYPVNLLSIMHHRWNLTSLARFVLWYIESFSEAAEMVARQVEQMWSEFAATGGGHLYSICSDRATEEELSGCLTRANYLAWRGLDSPDESHRPLDQDRSPLPMPHWLDVGVGGSAAVVLVLDKDFLFCSRHVVEFVFACFAKKHIILLHGKHASHRILAECIRNLSHVVVMEEGQTMEMSVTAIQDRLGIRGKAPGPVILYFDTQSKFEFVETCTDEFIQDMSTLTKMDKNLFVAFDVHGRSSVGFAFLNSVASKWAEVMQLVQESLLQGLKQDNADSLPSPVAKKWRVTDILGLAGETRGEDEEKLKRLQIEYDRLVHERNFEEAQQLKKSSHIMSKQLVRSLTDKVSERICISLGIEWRKPGPPRLMVKLVGER